MYIKIFQKSFHVVELMVRSSLVLLFIYCILPWRFASHYEYLSQVAIKGVLVSEITRNISLQRMEACNYDDIIEDNVYTYRNEQREQVQNSQEILPGGEYFPDNCRAKFSTAIIVPYRQREQQLHRFLIYMHNYLRGQRIHYRIFLIEQYDQKPFNRAKLFNIGAMIAADHGFPCLVLHDVDLLPLNQGQLYACSELPRHMCSALDTFRFNLPYRGLFGGVVGIRTEQFRMINGLSNMYSGWGGEDDDFFDRLRARNLDICRFPPEYSEYTMLRHKREIPNENRITLLRAAAQRFHLDGLNSLVYKERERRLHSLFTHILVET